MLDPKNLRILFIAGTLGRGGAERQLYYMLKALRDLDVHCRVLCLTRDEVYEERIRQLGVAVVWVGSSVSRATRLWSIIQEVQHWHPDILQSAHSYTNLYAAVAARLTQRISIGAVRTHGLQEFGSLGVFGKASAILPHHLFANSRPAIDSFRSKFPNILLHLVNNVVDCSEFFPVQRNSTDNVLSVLGIGRLHPQKRFDLFLRSIALLSDEFPNLAGTIIGEGSLNSRLVALTAELELANRVAFVGDQQNVQAFYHAADVFVLPSDFEGTPNVILEAMACGLPVVATRAGGTVDVIEHDKDGFLVPLNDVEQIAQHIRILARSADLRKRLGDEARRKIETHYCFDSLGARLMELYAHILDRQLVR